MYCPKCGQEQMDNAAECARCGIIFAKWGSRPSHGLRPPQPPPPAPLPTSVLTEPLPAGEEEPRGFPVLAAAALIGALILGAAARPVFFPKGHPIPEGAYRNEAHHFAVRAPGDWILMTPENYKELMVRIGDRLPSNLQGVMDPGRVAAGFIRLQENRPFAPSVNITPMEGRMPPLRQKDMSEAGALIATQLKTLFGDYTLQSADIVRVDKLDSLRIRGSGTLKIRQDVVIAEPPTYSTGPEFRFPVQRKPRTRSEWVSIPLTCLQFLVPGRNESYVMTCTSQTDDFESLEPVFAEIVDSFRVLKRPPPFGPAVNGALKGGLLAAVGYLAIFGIFGFLRKLFSL